MKNKATFKIKMSENIYPQKGKNYEKSDLVLFKSIYKHECNEILFVIMSSWPYFFFVWFFFFLLTLKLRIYYLYYQGGSKADFTYPFKHSSPHTSTHAELTTPSSIQNIY